MDNQEKLIPANIVVADRHYRIKVAPKDEQAVRQTVKLINEKILDYKTAFPGKDLQDYVSMVLVWFATEKAASGIPGSETDNLLDSLHKLETSLDRELS